MTILIEQLDPKILLVRCVNPINPPFKAAAVCHTIEEATECAASMLSFPETKKQKDKSNATT
jgi:hypothetical protein